MALDAQHDPDTSKRVFQCACSASQKNITPTGALIDGWRRQWHTDGSTSWTCPECRPSDPPPIAPMSVPPPPDSLLACAVGGSGDDRLHAQWILDRLEVSDPERRMVWLAYFLAALRKRKAIEDWGRWGHHRGLWDEPMLAQHSSRSNEHYTPPDLCDLVREVFGGPIHLDPASCAAANRLVRAERYYDARDNGLTLPWTGNVFFNPPGNELSVDGRRVSQPAYWYASLASRVEGSDPAAPEQAAFMCFNLELLRHTQAWAVRQPLEYAVVLFRERVRYYHQGPAGELVIGESPPHPSALIYMGPNTDRLREVFTREGPFAGYVHVAS